MAYTNGIYYIDCTTGNDGARTALGSCIVSDGTGKTLVTKNGHGLIEGAVVLGSSFTNYLSVYLVNYER